MSKSDSLKEGKQNHQTQIQNELISPKEKGDSARIERAFLLPGQQFLTWSSGRSQSLHLWFSFPSQFETGRFEDLTLVLLTQLAPNSTVYGLPFGSLPKSVWITRPPNASRYSMMIKSFIDELDKAC